MNPLADQILEVLILGPRTLAEIHTLLNRPQKDVSILPMIGALVASGKVVKVERQLPELPDYLERHLPSAPAPIRFALPEKKP